MKFKKWFKFAVLLTVLALLPLLIGQQPLSDAQLRQIIADWLGYPVDQIQFKDYMITSSPELTVSAVNPERQDDFRVQEYEVILPNNMVYYVSIDRYTGFIYHAGNIIQIPGLTKDKMISPSRAIELARQYLQRYYIWADTSDWEVTGISPEVENGQWTEVQPMISVGFEPPLQAPQLPQGVVFFNEAIWCGIAMDAVRGDLTGFGARYSQIDIPMEPLITADEAKNIARQYLIGKGIQVEGEGYWGAMMLAPDLETGHARLVYNFGFDCPLGDETYWAGWVGVDAHTGEVVYYQGP